MFCKLYKVIVTDDDNFDSAFLTLMEFKWYNLICTEIKDTTQDYQYNVRFLWNFEK